MAAWLEQEGTQGRGICPWRYIWDGSKEGNVPGAGHSVVCTAPSSAVGADCLVPLLPSSNSRSTSSTASSSSSAAGALSSSSPAVCSYPCPISLDASSSSSFSGSRSTTTWTNLRVDLRGPNGISRGKD